MVKHTEEFKQKQRTKKKRLKELNRKIKLINKYCIKNIELETLITITCNLDKKGNTKVWHLPIINEDW